MRSSHLPDFERMWPKIEAAMQHEVGGVAYSKDEVWQGVQSGEYQMFLGPKSVCIARLAETSFKRFAQCLWIGGRLKEVRLVILPDVVEWAAENSCEYIVGTGRRQWGAALRNDGFTEHSSIFVKAVKD